MNSVMIKGTNNGITVVLDKNQDFDSLKEEIKTKFASSSQFFKNANLALTFEGKELTDDEKKEAIKIITEVSDLNIICVVDDDEEKDIVFKNAIQKAIQTETKHPLYVPEMLSDKSGIGQFYKGTLRSGQQIESEGSLIILGDVNPGGKVIAKGNVIVLGNLKGNIFAGADGNSNAFVVALEMNPMQIKIADVIARSADASPRKKNSELCPKIAFIDEGSIYIEDITQDVFNDIRIN